MVEPKRIEDEQPAPWGQEVLAYDEARDEWCIAFYDDDARRLCARDLALFYLTPRLWWPLPEVPAVPPRA